MVSQSLNLEGPSDLSNIGFVLGLSWVTVLFLVVLTYKGQTEVVVQKFSVQLCFPDSSGSFSLDEDCQENLVEVTDCFLCMLLN